MPRPKPPQRTHRPRNRSRLRLPRWLLAAAGLLLSSALGARVLRRLDAVEVAGESMSPALRPGDFVLLLRGAPGAVAPPAHLAGRVVAAVPPGHDPSADGAHRAPSLVLKRIIGLPGESVRAGAAVQINGRELEEPYAHGEPPRERSRGVAALGPDEFFLLGDHRARSTDSRDFGAVRREAIIGRAVLRYWPPGRWGRIDNPPRRFRPQPPASDGPPPHPA